jgi:hypothetical protein
MMAILLPFVCPSRATKRTARVVRKTMPFEWLVVYKDLILFTAAADISLELDDILLAIQTNS